MTKRVVPAILGLALLLVTASCTGNSTMSSSPGPITGARASVLLAAGPPPTNASQAPDDIVSEPGGSAYRANVHVQGVPDKWPSIETTDTSLEGAAGVISVNYRRDIATKAGQVRNNLLTVRKPGDGIDSQMSTIALYTVGAPTGMRFLEADAGGMPGTVAALLVIEIPPSVPPGCTHSGSA